MKQLSLYFESLLVDKNTCMRFVEDAVCVWADRILELTGERSLEREDFYIRQKELSKLEGSDE